MLHIYIDTNVFLRFYSYSDDALTEVEKLIALIKSKSVKAYTTQQTVDEYARNRDAEVAEALKRLEAITVTAQLPRFAHGFEEAIELTNALKKVKDARAALLSTLRKALTNGTLKADHTIEDILRTSQMIEHDSAILSKAELRARLGNPPGKNGSIGDQINWECLLSAVTHGKTLHVISRDGDYSAKDDKSRINHFLKREWKNRKDADIILYNGLGAFTKKYFPDIKVPSDAIKIFAVKSLVSSTNFSNTHDQVASLNDVFEEINSKEATSLFQAMIDNPQINGIAYDEDIESFYKKLYVKFFLDTSFEMDQALQELASYLDVELW